MTVRDVTSATFMPSAMSTDALADVVIEGIKKFHHYAPYIRELKNRFDDGERDSSNRLLAPIKECYSWKEFCDKHLDRTARTVRRMLKHENRTDLNEPVSLRKGTLMFVRHLFDAAQFDESEEPPHPFAFPLAGKSLEDLRPFVNTVRRMLDHFEQTAQEFEAQEIYKQSLEASDTSPLPSHDPTPPTPPTRAADALTRKKAALTPTPTNPTARRTPTFWETEPEPSLIITDDPDSDTAPDESVTPESPFVCDCGHVFGKTLISWSYEENLYFIFCEQCGKFYTMSKTPRGVKGPEDCLQIPPGLLDRLYGKAQQFKYLPTPLVHDAKGIGGRAKKDLIERIKTGEWRKGASKDLPNVAILYAVEIAERSLNAVKCATDYAQRSMSVLPPWVVTAMKERYTTETVSDAGDASEPSTSIVPVALPDKATQSAVDVAMSDNGVLRDFPWRPMEGLEKVFGKDRVRIKDFHSNKYSFHNVAYNNVQVSFLMDKRDLMRFVESALKFWSPPLVKGKP